ncbi:transferrin-binding protein-like solute binding protein [Thiobacillus denitrificans]|uniref:Transferrin-binding protein B C-lobe/N-lobe beta-barrel domain-containing protein n=1 Tax=Thiobacillus denitrificans TaxID=36861 RepID=A0A106BR81_THIDE|nr:transferrin-binding protein-like solute binding protein [Thiobacillus denitrificans]KVW97149.1 hypothetical protein ABW22_04850 [Thiobacillus denitrificans]
MKTVAGKRTALLSVSLILSACGGGGGGSAPTPAPTPIATTAFTKWSAVQPGVNYKADGLGQEVTGTASGGQFIAITPSGVADGYSAYLTFDSALELSRLALTTPAPTLVVLDKADGATFTNLTLTPGASPQFVGARNSTSVAVTAKPIDLGWEYQTFGVWETGLGTTSRTFGAMSVGNTAGTAIPDSGTATFTGYTTGSYVNTAGAGTTVFADLTVIADFGTARSLTFKTNNTQTSSDWVVFTSKPDLNLNGALTIAAGTNSFTGSVNSVGGLAGNSTGQFYGPNAEELGGVFLLQGSGVETYAGAYGAKQTP